MKFFTSSSLVLGVATLPFIVAHVDGSAHHLYPRQASSSSSTSINTTPTPPPPPSKPASTPSSTSTSAAAPPPPPPPPPPPQSPPSGSTTVAVTTPSVTVITSGSVIISSTLVQSTPTTIYTFSLEATNPTAVPLSAIISTAASAATRPLDHTFTPGSLPTFLPGAPPLPNAAALSPASYPPLDRPPPIDSPEVQQWIQEVSNSGVSIPNLSVTNLGGCVNNTAAAADTSRCWWTCGGCTRQSDVTECPDKMSWGLTYDDGPSFYTSDLLNYLDQAHLKSTFFAVGSRVISFPNILQTQYMSEHQIAVHTWSHPQLTTQTNEQIIAELGWSKKVIKDVLGVTPNMMRPPFGDIDDRVRAISIAMGLTPVMWTRVSPTATFDTDDFNIHNGITPVQKVLQNWENILGNATTRNSGFIVLEHDLFQQSVEVATGYILPDALAHKPPFTIQPVINCLNKPLTDAYIETNDNKTNPPAQSGVAVTLSAGAPGSVQATAGADSKSAASSLSVGLPLATLTTVIGIAAGFFAISA